ncbi:hypothetical protein TNCV_571451 [Trichonephila clavipes]|nr:hypothetical protein TNCV_571451 [Trichonephila clavipes]
MLLHCWCAFGVLLLTVSAAAFWKTNGQPFRFPVVRDVTAIFIRHAAFPEVSVIGLSEEERFLSDSVRFGVKDLFGLLVFRTSQKE